MRTAASDRQVGADAIEQANHGIAVAAVATDQPMSAALPDIASPRHRFDWRLRDWFFRGRIAPKRRR
jgi:phage tail protein X